VSLSQSRTIQTPEQQMNERQAVLEQRKRINALLVDHQQQIRLKAAIENVIEPKIEQVNPE
jgi:hypothetical protein